MYEWLLFAHLLGAFAFFAGAAVAAVGQLVAIRRERPSEVALVLGLTRWGVLLVALGGLLTIGFGAWLVADLPHWTFRQAWIEWAFVLWVGAMVLGALGGRPARHARQLAERLARDGDQPSEELRRAVADRRALALSFASSALLVAIVVLMVWKPA